MQFNDTKCNKWHPQWCSGWCCSVSRVEFSGLGTGASVSILQVPPTVQKCARHGWLGISMRWIVGHRTLYASKHSYSFISIRCFGSVVKLRWTSLQSPRRWIPSPPTLGFILCVSARLPPGLGNKVKPQKGFIADPATQARPNWLIYLFLLPSRLGNLSLDRGGANLQLLVYIEEENTKVSKFGEPCVSGCCKVPNGSD